MSSKGEGRLRASRDSVEEKLGQLHGEVGPTAPEFTLHGVAHSEALGETAELVYGDGIRKFNPLETWVLAMAFLFHDAAMGGIPPDEDMVDVLGVEVWRDLLATTFSEMRGRSPSRSELDDPPADVEKACWTRAVRATHARRGGDLATKAWKSDDGDEYLIEDSGLRRAYGWLIGKLAASHWADVGDLPDLFPQDVGALPDMPQEWTVDPLKLACILRLADAAQVDSSRAPAFLFALRNPQGVSREHWLFQQHMVRPTRRKGEDRIRYSSSPFEKKDATAWWRALAYLQEVDRELRRVDHLLCDLRRPRMAARGVAGVDKPERFATFFPVDGWVPIDARVDISDVGSHIAVLGGEQLYGRNRAEVALRELIQNAQDAIEARRVMDPEFTGGTVTVRLAKEGDDRLLEVRDDGVGMDVGILKDGLLDFGRSGWRTDAVKAAFPGLLSGGFRPVGSFGVGFYSVLMLGDEVKVTTRRFDLAAAEARQLSFDEGLRTRPMVCRLPAIPAAPRGTTVRVVLRRPEELLATTSNDSLVELVRRLVLSHTVPITVIEPGEDDDRRSELAPFDIGTAAPEQVFDQLYPPRQGYLDNEGVRLEARTEFCAQATEIPGDDGRRIGLAVLGPHVTSHYREAQGVVLLHGFRADRCPDFTGYIAGTPGRASRDHVEPACTSRQLALWVASQVRCLRDRGMFDASAQLDLADIALQTTGELDHDHCVALTSEGPLAVGDIGAWAAGRDEILISYGGPCEWETRPPGLWHRAEGRAVTPPPDWLVLGPTPRFPTFEGLLSPRRDPDYVQHRHDAGQTWQKRWWRVSGDFEGLVLRHVALSWNCTLGDLLGPPAEREWKDYASMIPGVTESLVLRLGRPRP
jgi:hypothetical protein